MYYKTSYKSKLGNIIIAACEDALIGLWIEGQKYEYKTVPKEDIIETKNKIFFHFDSPSVIDKIETIMDYLKNDWMEYILNLPITTPVFFDLIQNGKYHSFKATPEKINTIIKVFNLIFTCFFPSIFSPFVLLNSTIKYYHTVYILLFIILRLLY